jgi:hypothetical protein
MRLITHGEIKPGDLGWAKTTGLLGLLIRFGEWLKFRKADYNHAFTVVGVSETGEVHIVEATLRGVKFSLLSDLLDKGATVEILPPPSHADRTRIIEFNLKQVGDHYSLLSDVCIALDILTWDNFPSVRRNGTWQCSALQMEALRYAGYFADWGDIYTVTPTQSYEIVKSCITPKSSPEQN